ncbi:MAG: hypothetical protein K940chlam8_01178 [Chlamydiae bacterium]|nr:hypothetical protein [Chlamydiota bacterium]
MRTFLKTTLLVLATSMLFAIEDNPTDNEPGEKDLQFLRDWFKEKRAVSIEDKGGDLSLSGVVRATYDNLSAKRWYLDNGQEVGEQQYNNTDSNTAENNFGIRFDIYFDYKTCNTWTHAEVKFANDMGTQGGSTSGINLVKAYFGYRIFEDGATIFDVEVGRNKNYARFDSKVQFNSFLDGVLAKYVTHFGDFLEFDIRAAGTVVDFVEKQFGWIAQLSLNNIGGFGLYFRYAFSWWFKRGPTRVFNGEGDALKSVTLSNNPQNRFKISQFLLGYELDPEVLHFPVNFYAAILLNHSALRGHINPYTRNFTQGNEPQNLFGGKKEHIAWYAGLTAGKLEKKGDWSVEVTYQVVEAQSVPEWDMAGIGNGNPNDFSIYADLLPDVSTPDDPSIPDDKGFPYGNTNFKGWNFNFGYLITTNISIILDYSFTNEKIGDLNPATLRPFPGKSDYHDFGVQLLYAF